MRSVAPARRVAVETAVLEAVRALLREVGSAQAAESASLRSSLDRDLGLGSLERVELLVRLESALGVRLPESGAQAAETPADWVQTIVAAQAGPPANARRPITQPDREAQPPPADSATFDEVLRRQAERDPGRVHIHLLDQDWGTDISCGELYARACDVASGLAASGLRPGETVGIMLPTCSDFFSSFLGVTLAGGIAVPVYPPTRANQIEEYIRRQSLILRNAGIRFLISFDRIRAVASALESGLPSLREVVGAGELASRGRSLPPPGVEPPETFFIQYTSGSTGDPKGVTLTHSNVLANIRGIGFAVEARPTDTVVSWLPLYHDMGLIGSWLFSLYHGFPITILSPIDFLVRPERWLWALSDSRGTLCPAPNFAFELCVRKIRDDALEGVDLSRWRVAINAGEPVLPATLDRFSERFRPWGFDRRSLMPFYGLAESSVALTYPPFWRGPVVDRIERPAFEAEGRAVPTQAAGSADVQEFVGNGRPLPGHEVRVADDAGRELPDRRRGRILFRGPSRTNGYFRNREATASVLDACGWMDSGDLGYRVGGELYVTGRLKDCIIKGGRNVIPQDIEMAAWKVDGVRKGCVAAFGCIDSETGTEKLVVVAETRATDSARKRRIRAEVTEAVASDVGIPPDDVVLAHPGFVPKTSSGKIQRTATRRLYESGLTGARSGTPAWMQLARVWMRGTAGTSGRAISRVGARSVEAAAALLGGLAAAAFGLLARLAPTPAGARRFVSPGARITARLAGARVRGRVACNGAKMLLVSRASRLDPLVVAAAVDAPFVFADSTGFSGLGPAQAFLLEPLVAGTNGGRRMVGANGSHPQASDALSGGRSVVGFADSPPGEPPARTRFRAELLAAAAESGASVVPVALQGGPGGTCRALQCDPLAELAANGDPSLGREAVRAALEGATAGTRR